MSPIFLAMFSLEAAYIISKALTQSCRSNVRKEKSLYLSQYGVVTQTIECGSKASAVDGERFCMLIMILH